MHLLPTFAQAHKDIAPLLNQIHHADCFDLLARIPDASVDMALLDLPYGITNCKWDTIIPLEPMWRELKRVVKPRAAIVMTATQPFTSRLVSSNYEWYRSHWIWDKKLSAGFQIANVRQLMQHEDIVVFGYPSVKYYPQLIKRDKPKITLQGKSSTLLSNVLIPRSHSPNFMYPTSIITVHNADRINTIHPTQKPVALFEYLIKTYTQENEIVLDFVSGSGTTALACMKTNRQFICGDITLDYVLASRQRLQEADPYTHSELGNGMKQLSLFEGIA